jgi:hypothetical protein
MPFISEIANLQGASGLPAAAVHALLAAKSRLFLATQRFGDGAPAAAVPAARVYDMLVGHPAVAVRSAMTALADLLHWAEQASSAALHQEQRHQPRRKQLRAALLG